MHEAAAKETYHYYLHIALIPQQATAAAYNIGGNSIPLALQFKTSIGFATAHLNVISCVNTYSCRKTNADSDVKEDFLLN